MLIGPVLALLLVLLFYKKDVNHMGVVWVPPEQRFPGPPVVGIPKVGAATGAEPARDLATAGTGRWPAYVPPAEPMDLNDVFRRR